MPGKSLEQPMVSTETKIRQLEAQKRLLAQQVKTQQRKQRTRQLIQIGAIMARLGVDTVGKAEALQRVADAQPEVRTWLTQVAALVAGEGEPLPQHQMLSSGTDRGRPWPAPVDRKAPRLEGPVKAVAGFAGGAACASLEWVLQPWSGSAVTDTE